ncbi:MAG: CoA transferase [Synergistaceae bacterium]|jgi:crotonobetainyl-CoA:carnitine CoA-transferase CaiB-like acyl-CoA transferase|nr:CoA transferase [Synergistaceae bacterium]
MSGILEGIRVIDLSRFVAGPHCTQLLGDMGADVIKVEKLDGDDGRHMKPAIADISTYFMINNRNKRSITLDFKNPEGRKILLDLIRKSDVLVENFRPGVMEKMGLGYSSLKELNSGLIMASISGFGQDGPYAGRPAFDSVVQAMGGLMDLTGDNDPVLCGTWVGDYSSGLTAAYGIALALYQREKTGVGQYMDVAMLDCVFAWIRSSMPDYLLFGKRHQRQGARDLYRCPVGTFKTKDGFIYVSAVTQQQFENFTVAVGHPEWGQDPRFHEESARLKNSGELNALLSSCTELHTSEEITEMMIRADVPCAPVNNIEQVLMNPQLKHRRQIRKVKIHTGDEIPTTGVVIRFQDNPGDVRLPPPGTGEHNKEVYCGELGFTEAELEQLREKGII